MKSSKEARSVGSVVERGGSTCGFEDRVYLDSIPLY